VLTEWLYEMHFRVLKKGDAARVVFVKQTKRFHQNRMSMLLCTAWWRLDPMRAIDFADVLERFRARLPATAAEHFSSSIPRRTSLRKTSRNGDRDVRSL
jgi:hypothetical protein